MGLLRRLFGTEPPPPEWASFFSAGEFADFIAATRRDLQRRGLAGELDPQEGVVRPELTGEDAPVWGLHNLAQICLQAPPREWRQVIAGHFDQMLALRQMSAVLDRLGTDWEEARPYLKVRLYPPELAHQGQLVYWAPFEGVIAALVYDFPDSVGSVAPDHVKHWGVERQELFRIGLDHVRQSAPPADENVDLGDGAAVRLLSSEDHFTATRVLFLEEHLQPVPELGAVVGVPHRHAIVYHPIVDEMVLPAVMAMIPIVRGMFQEGPGSISPELFWWQPGRFVRLPVEEADREVTFRVPEAFQREVLDRVAPAAEPAP